MIAWNVLRQVEGSWVSSLAVAGTAASVVGIAPDGPARALGLAIAGLAGTAVALACTARACRWWRSGRPKFIVQSRPAADIDLHAIFRIARRAFGPKISSEEVMRRWHSVNPGIFTVIERLRRTPDGEVIAEISGYVAAIPLDKRVADLVAHKKMAIVDLDARDICPPSQAPDGLYVGAIVAMDGPSQGAAVISLRTRLRQMSRGRRATLLICNPVTSDGLQLVRTCGMRPVDPGAESAKKVLHISTLGEVDSALRERSRARSSPARPLARGSKAGGRPNARKGRSNAATK